MNHSKIVAVLAIVGALVGAASNYFTSGAMPDITILLPLIMAAYSAFHASNPAPVAPVK